MFMCYVRDNRIEAFESHYTARLSREEIALLLSGRIEGLVLYRVVQ